MKDNYIDAVIGPQSSHNFNEKKIKIEIKKKKIEFYKL